MSLYLPSSLNGDKDAIGLEDGTSGAGLTGTGLLLESPGPKIKLNDKFSSGDVMSRVIGGDAAAGAMDVAGGLIAGGEFATAVEEFNTVIGESSLFSMFEVTNNIQLKLGYFYYLPSIVILGVSQEYQIRIERKSRKPISLTANVSVRSFVTPKREDIATMIPKGRVNYG